MFNDVEDYYSQMLTCTNRSEVEEEIFDFLRHRVFMGKVRIEKVSEIMDKLYPLLYPEQYEPLSDTL